MKNKGFAITALLYGLTIMALMTVVLMMSIMQNTRKNNTTLVKGIEEQLNNYASSSIYLTTTSASPIQIKEAGYYKVQLCGGNPSGNKTFTSGTVYLKEGDTISFSTTNSYSNFSINEEEKMFASMSNSANKIEGSALAPHNGNATNKYPFLNPLKIFGSSCTPSLRMYKLSDDAPTNNITYFDNITKIKANGATTITAVAYTAPHDAEPATATYLTGSSNTLNIASSYTAGDNKMISDISIKFGADVTRSTTQNGLEITGPPNITTPLQLTANGNYTFSKGADYTFSRYGPIGGNIPTGNYVISLANKSSNVYTINKSKVLATSTYTPPSCTIANNPGNENLVHFGQESLARPVVVNNYISTNGQKWRIEALTDAEDAGLYKITEIEEYKPFEVHKHDSSVSESGPRLVCGIYTCKGSEFKSTDDWRNNGNQKWKIESVGLGLYRFKTNNDLSINRYLYYKNDTELYLTEDSNKASLFYLYNADI